jgi:hypothetical protein
MGTPYENLLNNETFRNIFAYSKSPLRNIVHCVSSPPTTPPTTSYKVKDVTIKIDENNEFLREGMYYISPSISNSNMVFEANTNIPSITQDKTTKRNYWNDIGNTNLNIGNLMNNSNLIFSYAIQDDYEQYKKYDNLRSYCRANPDNILPNNTSQPITPNRKTFQDIANLGIVDMYISFINYNLINSSEILQPEYLDDFSSAEGYYLYDGDDILQSSNKLIPQFKKIKRNSPVLENRDNYIWTVRYLGDNKFTIQNKQTGRFLKAFDYYNSTLIYEGDNSSIEYNTNVWNIENIFPEKNNQGTDVNIARNLIDVIITKLKNNIPIGSLIRTQTKNFLNDIFCGKSDTFIDNVQKINYSITPLNPITIIDTYTRICACNMSSDFYVAKNCGYKKLLKAIGHESCVPVNAGNVDTKSVEDLIQNWKCTQPICSDNTCNKLSNDTAFKIVEELEDSSGANGCGNSTTCIQSVTNIIEGTVTGGWEQELNQTMNCGLSNTFNLNAFLNFNPTLLYLPNKDSNKLYKFTTDCYNKYSNEKNTSCYNIDSVSCILNTDECKNQFLIACPQPIRLKTRYH